MNLLIVSSEASPFAKTGGLGDVIGNLMNGLLRERIDAKLIMPLYQKIKENFNLKDTGLKIKIVLGNKGYQGKMFSFGDKVSFLRCEDFFERQELYGTKDGDYVDNAQRFIFFSKAVIEACKAINFIPSVIHCNDWQTGLIPLYIKTIYKRHFSRTATIFTIHNLGYQGIFLPSIMSLTGLPLEVFNPEFIEFYGRVNFLKAGIVSSDAITTVSMSYAKEILTPEYGFGLDGVLRKRSSQLTGILNGIDYTEWNPSKDNFISCNYSKKALSGKSVCKSELMRECKLKGKRPLLAMVGRLSSQKGIDIFISALQELIIEGVNIVILGKGDGPFEKELERLTKKYPSNISLHLSYDSALAHRIYAGSDILLMPSRYEPCGLSQMIALRYGTIPVARKTGGIADTVDDYNHLNEVGTGFLFTDYTSSALRQCLMRALCVYQDKEKWKRLMLSGMGKDFSWKSSINKYIRLYEATVKRVRG